VSIKQVLSGVFMPLAIVALGFVAADGQGANPVVVASGSYTQRPMAVAQRNNLYCAGTVQNAAVDTSMQIVRGHEEQDQFTYSENNFVYINAGADKNVNVGDVLSVVRPRGKVSSHWSSKGNLGFYVQEVGAVEVIRVKPEHSVARIKVSCDNFVLGDVVQPIEERKSPLHEERPALDRFSDPNGKPIGRLFMARGNMEMITRDHIVYVDLGKEDDLKVGDYLTVFRKVGKGNLFIPGQSETVSGSDGGFESDKYRGGTFSNQASRKSGKKSGGSSISESSAKSELKAPRKVVGELVVLSVSERTATAVVVRTGMEIHPGDYVEVQ
jgi:hypothetical protein